MFGEMNIVVIGVAILMFGALLTIMALFLFRPEESVDDRLKSLTETRSHDPFKSSNQQQDVRAIRSQVGENIKKIGTIMMPDENDKNRTQLKSRMIHAGFYSPSALPLFVGVKALMTFAPALIALLLGAAGLFSIQTALIIAVVGCVVGLIGPSFWLDNRKKARQTAIRRGLPDAMDVLVICLEGGVSLDASLARVGEELSKAHPILANELKICQRQIQMGQNAGEALQNFSRRADMEEIRSLAGVVIQAQKYGSSMANALRVHADSLRQKRSQKAEEMAQKASTKILFPTLLFIFPAIFLVILGPAVIQMYRVLVK
ncbi:Type II secretion protein F [Planctomycetales bacterium 10988]|nr:Type II secretion protein F [Planctomycetales bacterium 10988]